MTQTPHDDLTHIYYTQVPISTTGIADSDSTKWASFSSSQPDGYTGSYATMKRLKSWKPEQKMILSVGGPSNSGNFANLVSSTSNINSFASNALTYCQNNGFDGIDIYWYQPSNGAGLTNLLKALKSTFGAKNMLVSVTVGYSTPDLKSVDIPGLNNADIVVAHTVWQCGPSWCNYNGHVTPLHPNPQDPNYTFGGTASVEALSNGGVDSSKIVIGAQGWGVALLNSGNTNGGLFQKNDQSTFYGDYSSNAGNYYR